MYIHSVRLTNYKSIGDYKESEIIIEPQITAIIGKNESGKSNVLEGLSCINLLNYNDVVYTPAVVNRNCPTGTQNERSRKIVKFSFGLSKKKPRIDRGFFVIIINFKLIRCLVFK